MIPQVLRDYSKQIRNFKHKVKISQAYLGVIIDNRLRVCLVFSDFIPHNIFMSSITAQEQTVRQRVLEKLWGYVDENFHKFTDVNKLKIVVALCAKSMPQIVEGNYSVTKMPSVKIDDKEQELNLGSRVTFDSPSSN